MSVTPVLRSALVAVGILGMLLVGASVAAVSAGSAEDSVSAGISISRHH